MPTLRKLTLLAVIVGSLVLIALVLLAGADAISVTAAVILGAIMMVLAAQVLAVVTVRRVDGKALRIDNRAKRYEAELAKVRAATERLDRRLDEIVELLREDGRRRDEDLQAILISLGEDRMAAMPQRLEIEEMVHEVLPRLAAVEARTERAEREGREGEA